MSDKIPIIKMSDHSDSVFIICVFVLIILCAGSPDLLDAIVHKLMK